MRDTFRIWLFPLLGLLGAARDGPVDKEFIPSIILASCPRIRLLFIHLIRENAGTNLLLGFRRVIIRDVWMDSIFAICL